MDSRVGLEFAMPLIRYVKKFLIWETIFNFFFYSVVGAIISKHLNPLRRFKTTLLININSYIYLNFRKCA